LLWKIGRDLSPQQKRLKKLVKPLSKKIHPRANCFLVSIMLRKVSFKTFFGNVSVDTKSSPKNGKHMFLSE